MALGAPDAAVTRLFLARSSFLVADAAPEVVAAFQDSVALDPGESQLLALAKQCSGALVLLDDELARTEARVLGWQ